MMKKYIKHVITFFTMTVAGIIIFIYKDGFHSTGKVLYMALCDSFFVPGIFSVLIALLIFAANGGTFDMLSFGVISIFDSLRRDPNNRKYKTFYDYRKEKSENKKPFLFLLIWGGLYIIIAIIFYLLLLL